MKRVLLVNESESPDLQAIIFYIDTPPDEPDVLSENGAIWVEVPGDGPGGYLRQIGTYNTNAEAQRAAEQYAADRGKKIVKWELSRRQSGRGSEPDLEADALPARNK